MSDKVNNVDSLPAKGQPCTLWWYDGGLKPPRPEELGSSEPFGNWDGGLLLEGSKGKIIAENYGDNARVLSPSGDLSKVKGTKTLPRYTGSHQGIWAESLQG